ncbi:hypothetical protein [Microtetraspora sp. NBRC 16547]|uniref:hypothetical protein n=1 Tax=Microtetraspora sp. NBRC 16547 TaxID=3030993 RepID=UPI0024A4B5E9|nr:hypothetical protein [Microtetraspora sp. NBRC 16547]GLX00604.1 hypothetical protein Misp02_46900 [Microtetraspora sp. NBRC 16547]
METETGCPPRSQCDLQAYSLHAHPVFPTKYRRGVFTGDLLSRGEYIMIKVAVSCGGARRDGRLSRLPLSIIREYIENQKRPDQRPGGEREAIPPGRERPGFLAKSR